MVTPRGSISTIVMYIFYPCHFHLPSLNTKKTAQEGNGASTVLTAVLDDETLPMVSTVVADPVIVAPVRKAPEVAKFTLQIDVTPPLPPPPPLTYPTHVPPPTTPPLTLELLPLIALPPSPSDSFSDK